MPVTYFFIFLPYYTSNIVSKTSTDQIEDYECLSSVFK